VKRRAPSAARAALVALVAVVTSGACVAPGTGWRSDPIVCRSLGAVAGGVGASAAASGSNRVAWGLVGMAAGALVGHLACEPRRGELSVRVSASPLGGDAPFQTELRAVSDGATRFDWELGDGGTAEGTRVTYTYRRPGTFHAEVTVADDEGRRAVARIRITVLKPRAQAAERSIVLRGVNFEFGSARLTAAGEDSLDAAAEELAADPETRVDVVGHTDSVGSDQDNLELSQARAQAVRDALVKRGIDASRLSARGSGESDPEASNDTPDGRAQNRRVELRVH
jgi:OOP family OmpA-OmpF porin